MKRVIGFAFVFVAATLILSACKSSEQFFVHFTNGRALACEATHTYLEGGGGEGLFQSTITYTCNLPCPDGSVSIIELSGRPEIGKRFDKAQTVSKYCGVQAFLTSGEESSSAGGSSADSALFPAVDEALPASLTAHVNACTLAQGYITFTLSDQAPDLTNKKLEVSINNDPVACLTTSEGPKTFRCTLPQKIKFPALVIIKLDGAEVNRFIYSGADCSTTSIIPVTGGETSDLEGVFEGASLSAAMTPVLPTNVPPSPKPPTVVFPTVPTEAPTEVATENPTEAPTELPTDLPTDEPTENPTDVPTEVTEPPTEVPTEVTEPPTEAPTENPTEPPTEAPTEEPTEAPTEAPTDPPPDVPTDAPTDQP